MPFLNLFQNKYNFISGINKNTYKTIKKIGQGGTASVYLVYRNNNKDDKFVLKKFRRDISVSNEIVIHELLDHPNIVKIYDSSNVNRFLIILEYCKLGKLQDNIRKDKIKYYMTSIIDALKYLQSQKVVHRDLTLANIYLDDTQNVKIGDFGLAINTFEYCEGEKITDNKCKMSLCGTPDYIAPEVVMNNITCDQIYKIDIWALGVIFYYLLTDNLPFNIADTYFYDAFSFDNILYLKYRKLYSSNAQILLDNMFKLNPNERISIDELQKASYFIN